MGNASYLESAERQFQYYKSLGEKAMEQVEPEHLFWRPNDESNSIAMIVQHLWGNMLSRWTNFLTEDGEKPWRQRDAEFEPNLQTKEEVMLKWDEGWKCLFDALKTITDNDVSRIVYIRNEGDSILSAINRQLAHYPYHVGQMIYIAKLIKNDAWKSLSIPKNKSGDYNAGKFSQEKELKHFTDDWLKK